MVSNNVARLNAHGRSAFEKLADHVSDAEVARFGPLTAVSVGIPAPIYNQIFTFEVPARGELEAAVSWMANRDVPFWVTVTEPLVEDVGDQIAESGLTKAEEVNPGMIMPSLAEIPSNETDAAISTVTDADLLDEFIETFATVFETPLKYARQSNPSSLLEDEDIRMFIGRIDGEAVACGQFVRTGDVAGVYGVGVREKFRRQGIGEAMTWAVLRAGREAECQIGALQSTEIAYSLYQRMGFETVVSYHHFEPTS